MPLDISGLDLPGLMDLGSIPVLRGALCTLVRSSLCSIPIRADGVSLVWRREMLPLDVINREGFAPRICLSGVCIPYLQ